MGSHAFSHDHSHDHNSLHNFAHTIPFDTDADANTDLDLNNDNQEKQSSNQTKTESSEHFHTCHSSLYVFLQDFDLIARMYFVVTSHVDLPNQIKPGPWLDGPYYPPRKTLNI